MSPLRLLSLSRPGLAAFATMGVVWGSFAACLPDVKAQLGADEHALGLLLLFTPMAAVVSMLCAPIIGSALGRVALPLACLAMALAFALPGQVTVMALFPLAMMVCGFGTGMTDVLMNARVAAIENDRGVPLMNLCHAGYSFGYAGGALLTGMLRAQGWGPAVVLGTMSLLAAAVALLTVERDGTIHGLRRPKGGGAAGGLGLLPLIGGGIVLIAFMTENATESWSALHIEKTLGGSPAEGAMGPAAIALTMGVARLFGQGLAARVGPVVLLCGGALIAAIGALIAAGAQVPAMAYAGFIIAGFGGSVIAPTAFSLVGRLAAPEARARAIARATLFGYCGYFVGPPSLGFIAGTFGLRAAFVFAAVMMLAVLVLAPLMGREADRTRLA